MKTTRLRTILAGGLLTLALSIPGAGADPESAAWPRYRGPELTGISTQTGLLKSWPEKGPRVAWRVELGDGYSGISVAGGRLYTMYSNDEGEYLASFDATNGARTWQVRLDSNRTDNYGDGPRSTPTLEGDTVYALGARGILVAVGASDGKLAWQKDLKEEFSARVPQFGVSTSPIVEGELILIDTGAKSGGSLVALEKKTGATRWRAHSDKPGYSTPLPVEIHGTRQVLFFAGTTLTAVTTADGKVLWSVPWKTSYDINAAMPVLVGPDKVFISSGYDKGAGLFQVRKDGDSWKADEVWASNVMKNHFNSSVLHKGHLYGFDNGTLKCIQAQTGVEKWAHRGFAKGSLLLADGHLVILSEDGLLALAEATPSDYKEKARAQVLEGRTWTMPSLAGGRLYLRNQTEMVALEITG